MSHANGLVRFADGAVFYFEYDGTSDYCRPKLWARYEDMHAHWREEGFERKCTCGNAPEDVEAFTDYGRGSHWVTKACRKCMCITLLERSYDAVGYCDDGVPDWAADFTRG